MKRPLAVVHMKEQACRDSRERLDGAWLQQLCSDKKKVNLSNMKEVNFFFKAYYF